MYQDDAIILWFRISYQRIRTRETKYSIMKHEQRHYSEILTQGKVFRNSISSIVLDPARVLPKNTPYRRSLRKKEGFPIGIHRCPEKIIIYVFTSKGLVKGCIIPSGARNDKKHMHIYTRLLRSLRHGIIKTRTHYKQNC